jgi:hypothetical protein
MLPLHDGHLRLILLASLVARLEHGGKAECQGAGIEPEQLECLRSLSMADIKRLASLRHPLIGVVVDGATFATGLRNLAVVRETQSLEWYFIRHGASQKMMTSLFKMTKRTAILRLRAQGQRRSRGRPRLPPMAVRDRMHRFWAEHARLDLKNRYHRLHQAFSSYTLHTLSGVINEFERPK